MFKISLQRSDQIIILLLMISITVLAGAMLSLGARQAFWLVDKPIALPFLTAWLLTAFIFTSVYLSLWTKGTWRMVSRYCVAIGLLSIIAIAVAAITYKIRTGQHVSVFSPLWVSVYNIGDRHQQLICLLVSFAVIVVLPVLAILVRLKRHNNDKGAHFQSHWELARNKHFVPKGFPLGLHRGEKVFADPVSLLLIATTGSYKTSALIIPTLFEFAGSSISTDIKSELWEKTAPYFKGTSVKVARFILFGDGTEEDYTRINPFVYVPWENEKALNMLNLIVRTLIPTLKNVPGIWEEASRDTVRAVAAHYYLENTHPDDVTLEKVIRFISRPNLFDNLSTIYEAHVEHPLYGYWFDIWLAKLLGIEDQKLKDSLIYSAQKDIASLFLPTVLRAMSGNDVDLRTLRQNRTALFIDVPQGRSDEVKIFLNLFYNVFMTLIAELGEPQDNERYNILLNMEEFGDIGKVDKLASGANTFRSFGLRFIFVVQNIGQIEEHYGRNTAKTFLSSGAIIKDGDNNLEDNRYFAELMGEKRVKKTEGHGKAKRQTTTYRPLMTPEAIRTLSKKYWLVFLENERPIKLIKIWDKKLYKDFLIKNSE